jgi:hypothetical protein
MPFSVFSLQSSPLCADTILDYHCKWYKRCYNEKSFVKVVVKAKAVHVTGLEWPRGFQKVKVHRFHDNGTGWW